MNWKESGFLIIAGVVLLIIVSWVGSNNERQDDDDLKLTKLTGVWGGVSSIDWCEENFAYTPYVAEFWNTVSNIGFCCLGCFALIKYWRWMEPRFVVSFVCIALIGVGSALFHATLVFTAQLFDELPMLYFTGSLLYVVVEHLAIRPHTRHLPVALVVAIGLFTLVYVWLRWPSLFQLFWATCTFVAVYRMTNLVITHFDAADRYPVVVATKTLVASGAIWVTEQAFCHTLPFIATFRLHALWHLGTSFAGYSAITGLLYTRLRFVLKKPVELAYCAHFLPYIRASSHSISVPLDKQGVKRLRTSG